MLHTPSKNDSSGTCPHNAESLFDLNLPVVAGSDEPLPPDAPSWEAQIAHARFLISTKTPEYWKERLARMNPEPFVL